MKKLFALFSRCIYITLVIMMAYALPARAQKARTIGLEIQAYPAGVIMTLRGGIEVGPQQEFSLRLGYNYTDRGDFGEHDNEEGGGPGFSLGYRYYTKNNLDGFFIGARADLWFLDIDWRDPFVCPPGAICTQQAGGQITGNTDVVVLQPTAEIGYNILSGRSNWLLAPTAAFGWEINVHTDGENVGEGAIFLVGLNVAYLF